MKEIILNGKKQMVTDRHAFLLKETGKLELPNEQKEEKKESETKENKVVVKRQTKGKK